MKLTFCPIWPSKFTHHYSTTWCCMQVIVWAATEFVSPVIKFISLKLTKWCNTYKDLIVAVLSLFQDLCEKFYNGLTFYVNVTEILTLHIEKHITYKLSSDHWLPMINMHLIQATSTEIVGYDDICYSIEHKLDIVCIRSTCLMAINFFRWTLVLSFKLCLNVSSCLLIGLISCKISEISVNILFGVKMVIYRTAKPPLPPFV